METSLSIFPAWLLLLRIRLVQAIHLQGDFSLDISFANLTNQDVWSGDDRQIDKITALKRVKNTTQIVYLSAIPYQLAAYSSLVPEELATAILRGVSGNTSTIYLDQVYPRLSAEFEHLWHEIWRDIAVEITNTGLIQFLVGERAIALWLDWLIRYPPHMPPSASPAPEPVIAHTRIFAIQHAYARCCSLLQLANRQGMVSLVALPDSPWLWQLTTPKSLSGQALFAPAEPSPERHLISQFVTVMDRVVLRLGQAQADEWLQLAETVAQAWMQFHGERPLCGDQNQPSRDPTDCRLGLIMATQRVLRLLLEDLLGIYAPSEL